MAEWQLWVFKIWRIPLNTRTTLNNSTSLCTMIEKQLQVFKKTRTTLNNSTSLCRVAELQKLIFEQPNKGTLNNLTNYDHFAHWQKYNGESLNRWILFFLASAQFGEFGGVLFWFWSVVFLRRTQKEALQDLIKLIIISQCVKRASPV